MESYRDPRVAFLRAAGGFFCARGILAVMAGKTIAPGSTASAAGKPSVPSYLQAECFREANAGPLIEGRWRRSQERDPSPAQIRKRCLAILAAYPRPMVGESTAPYEFPVIAAPEGFDIDKVA